LVVIIVRIIEAGCGIAARLAVYAASSRILPSDTTNWLRAELA